MTAVLQPGTDAWRRLVTASKVSAILGISPWESQRSMWHLMRGDTPPTPVSDAMRRGNHLERGILNWYFEDHPELTRVGHEVSVTQDRLPWAAATPDDVATEADGTTFPVDAKTDARGDGWGEPGTDQVPLHYLTQAMFVMHLGGWDRFVFVRLGPWLDRDEFVVHYDADLAQQIEDRCRAFFLTLDAGTPPDLDGSVATYDAVRALSPIGDGEWEAPAELARELCDARAAVKDAETRHNLARSRCLDLMGEAKQVTYRGQLLGQKQRTARGASLYPPRRDVDLSIFTTTPDAPEAAA